MQIAKLAALAAFLVTSAHAHSWLECVNTEVENLEQCKANPSLTLKQNCIGFPRNKVNNGDWISESTNYVWDLNGPNAGGKACNPSQRSATYPGSAPMTVVTPGQKITLRWWGNGHSVLSSTIGSPKNRDPGFVRLYWAGKKDTPLENKSDLNEKTWIPGTQKGFADDAVTMIQGTYMEEKGNYMVFTVPEEIEVGVHNMVWTWAWTKAMGVNKDGFNPDTDYNVEWQDSYSTCFDIQVSKSDFTGTNPIMEEKQSAVSISSSSTKTLCYTSCLKGGQDSEVCTGKNCPPCWYQNGNKLSCYDYKLGTTTCPFGGAFNCENPSAYSRRALRFERAPFN